MGCICVVVRRRRCSLVGWIWNCFWIWVWIGNEIDTIVLNCIGNRKQWLLCLENDMRVGNSASPFHLCPNRRRRLIFSYTCDVVHARILSKEHHRGAQSRRHFFQFNLVSNTFLCNNIQSSITVARAIFLEHAQR